MPDIFWIWSSFIGFVVLMLALDLGVFHRKAHVIGMREALGWSAFWIALGLAFSLFIYAGYDRHWAGLGLAVDPVDNTVNRGPAALAKYVTGYVVEKSLSVDNIFVIAMIFRFFAVPAVYQHRVLFWGILGALAMRGAMIALGAKLIHEFHWILYIFGAFLILTGLKMLLVKTDHQDLNENWVVRLARRFLPLTTEYDGQRFAARGPGGAGLVFTPLALALILVEVTDLIFAVDSIPAIFAITGDPFLVFTSNVFAILGLRSLYFALAGMIDKFRYLKVALSMVLLVVGVKMLTASQLKAWLGSSFNFYLLAVVLLILTAGVVASLWRRPAPPDTR